MTTFRPHTVPTLLLAALLPLGACAPGTAPTDERPADEVAEYTIEQFLENTRLGGLSFSPDGASLLVSSDASGVFNAYEYPVDGGAPRQLTDSTGDPRFALGYLPDGERFLYSSDQGGNELDHIYVHEPDGSATDLTPGEGHKAVFYGWTPDHDAFFFGTNERDRKTFDIYAMETAGAASPGEAPERTELFQNDTGMNVSAVAPDRSHLALTKSISTSDSDVYLYERASGALRNLTEHEGFQSNRAVGFDPASEVLLYTTDAGREFRYLVAYDLASGERRNLVEAAWDVLGADYSDSGDYLSVWINNDARTEVRIYRTDSMEQVDLPDLPDAEISDVEFSPDENRIAFYASTARSPRNLYVSDLGGGEVRQLSDTLNPEIASEDLVAPEVVRFASYDGVEVPGLLYKPHGASPDNQVPALVWIHGGPGGQSRVGYSEAIQYLVNHGYAIFAINNRGSSGYGKTFYRLDDQKHGEADLDDVVASKRMLLDTGWVEEGKIGVTGGSYGGYLTLAAVTFRPEEFAVGVDFFGISNWVRTLESIPPWWEAIREALYAEMGDPDEQGERLRRISPLFHADRIQRPLMVLQGANDPRVLKQESDEIVEAARANGVPVRYLVFEDEGHGFLNKDNRAEAYREMLAFLDEHLKGEAPAETGNEDETGAEDEAADAAGTAGEREAA
jgi:dipeptidyl aminopeptidase/acylaminoacyl peptidase